MKSDLIFALRALRRAPAFFALAIATLGLGIAANTAIFSLFYQVLLRSIPARDPQSLVILHSDPPNLPGGSSSDNFETVFSYPLYLRLRDTSKSFQGLAARSGTSVQITAEGPAERARAEIVTGNFFEVLGLQPALGRLFSSADDSVRGGNPVTVLAFDFWQRRFAANPSILNRTILINSQPFVVIGVAPEHFRSLIAGDSPEIFIPISMRALLTPGWDWLEKPSMQWLTLLGRLKPGVSRERAGVELQPIYTAVIREHIDQIGVKNQAARQRLTAKRLELRAGAQGLNALERQWRKPLFVLLGMVLLLLVIGCANLANLLMARAVNRGREISIRFALGATRLRVLRLLTTESALLAVVGTLCGVGLAPLLTRAIIRLMPANELGGWLSAGVNLPVLAFSAGLMLTATLLFGLMPVLQAIRGDSSTLMQRTQTASSGHIDSGARKMLVAGQIALSLLLLATAGLFGRSLMNLMKHNPGFRVDHLLSFSVDAGNAGYNTDRGMSFYRELGQRLAALPGVEAASFTNNLPLSHSESSTNVTVEGYTPRNDDEMNVDINSVAPGYFRTIGTRIIEGREFDERDRRDASKVAVVNQAFARRFFGDKSPVGHKMAMGAGGPLDILIVGSSANANNLNLRETVLPTYYVPYEQSLSPGPRMRWATFFMRASSGFDSLPGSIRRAVAQLDGSIPVFAVQTMEAKVEESVYTDRLIAALSIAFGLLALLLTAVGLYGVLAYLVSRRTSEIGIRMVLGAAPATILAMILREVAVVFVIGAVVGLAGAAAVGRAIQSQLFGMFGIDLAVFTVAPLVLLTVALVAASIPAFRAARVQPLEALRHE